MNSIDNKINLYIFEHPDKVSGLLTQYGISQKYPVTLNSLSEAVYPAVYSTGHKDFVDALSSAIAHEGYKNFEPISLAVTSALSIASSFIGAGQARKQLETLKKIELAKLSNARMLGELDIRTQAETERTKILLQTLQQYQSDLQVQSTQRIKHTWIYVGMLAAGIAIIYGTAIMLSPNSKTQ